MIVLLHLLVLLPSLGARLGPGAIQGTGRDPGAVAREAGARALEEGRLDDALRALEDSWAVAPDYLETLNLLLQVARDDADARALWSETFLEQLADDEGRVVLTAEQKRLLAADNATSIQVVRQRTRAILELIQFAEEREVAAEKRPEERLVARWARRLALLLLEDAPVLRASLGAEVSPWLGSDPEAHVEVLEALQKEAKAALGQREPGVALRLARVMRGFASQANFSALFGPKPRGMVRWARSADKLVAKARELVAQAQGEPWSVDDLEWLTQEEAESFTRAHSDWSNPGCALSPSGWYRVETVCGLETLLGVSSTVEDHHRRLAKWYGSDPFVGPEGARKSELRQGTVRVVPEASGLEAEGAGFWWVGGFQGGDTTTLRFSVGTIEGLGHGLTHELTHRFDGALYPGQPAWLSEGKAVWTAAAFGTSSDTDFVSNHVSRGTIESAFVKGYGNEDKLRDLVSGQIEEYRDNYTAGYALYVFLNTWRSTEDGARLFQGQLQHFMEHGPVEHRPEGSRKPLAFFEQHFCDGKEGRPASFEDFSALFGTYIRGFYWKSLEPWVAWYAVDVPAPEQPSRNNALVEDEPTWVWSRQRAEPIFGQDQMRRAGRLLLERGRTRTAILALLEGLARDGRTPAVERLLADVLEREKRRDAAWALRELMVSPQGGPGRAAPFLKRLPATRAYLKDLTDAASLHLDQHRTLAAIALGADALRLARRLGVGRELEEENLPGLDGRLVGELLHPFARPRFALGRDGWREDDLVGFEERRVEGLWFADDEGALHVGRKRARHATGTTDRTAHQRHAFVRSQLELQPGTYRLHAKIGFTTSYVTGQVVFGFEHRDRNLRFGFTAGDFLYAIGESEQEPSFESVGWNLSGGRDRDGALPGSRLAGRHEFGGRRAGFELDLLVDGAAVEARLDGAFLGRYHTVDGAPIEGSVGFATSMGAVVVRSVTVQRLDRLRLSGAADLAPLALDLSARGLPDFEDLENRTLFGLDPPSNGELLLWVPADYREPGEEFDPARPMTRALSSALNLERQLLRNNLPQSFRLIVPEALGAQGLERLAVQLGLELDFPPNILTHRLDGRPPMGADGEVPDEQSDHSKRWLLFVDGQGVLRVARPYLAQSEELEPRLLRWLGAFRDYGRPDRDLPEALRAPEDQGLPNDDPGGVPEDDPGSVPGGDPHSDG